MYSFKNCSHFKAKWYLENFYPIDKKKTFLTRKIFGLDLSFMDVDQLRYK